MSKMNKLAAIATAVVFLAVPLASSAQSTSDLQAQIASLLAQVQALKAQTGVSSGSAVISAPSDNENNGTSATNSTLCPNPALTQTLYRGERDAQTGGQVSSLQDFLADYFNLSGSFTSGYFGAQTAAYVQKFQAAQNIQQVGYVGQLTRAAILTVCSGRATVVFPTQPTGDKGNPQSETCMYQSNNGSAARMLTQSSPGTQGCYTTCVTWRNEGYGVSDSGVCTDNQDGKISTFNITSGATAPQCTVQANPGNPSVGQTFTISWTSSFADYMTGLPTQDRWPANGSQAIQSSTPGTNTYNLMFHGAGGVQTCSVSVTTTGNTSASATIDQSSLSATANAAFTLSGTASGVQSVRVSIGQSGRNYFSSAPLPITNGRWQVNEYMGLDAGSYSVGVIGYTDGAGSQPVSGAGEGGLLTGGTLTVGATSTQPTVNIYYPTSSSVFTAGSSIQLGFSSSNALATFDVKLTGKGYGHDYGNVNPPETTGKLNFTLPSDALPSNYTSLSGYAFLIYYNGLQVASSPTFTITAPATTASATIDQSSLRQTSNIVALAGSAANTSGLILALEDPNYGGPRDYATISSGTVMQKTGYYLSSAAIPVYNGRWTSYDDHESNGTYLVLIYDWNSKALLTTGMLTVSGGSNVPNPIINSFYASPGTVAAGSLSTLYWSASNTAACGISGLTSGAPNVDLTKAVSGSTTSVQIGPFTQSATYELRCAPLTGATGAYAVKDITVVVTGTTNSPSISASPASGTAPLTTTFTVSGASASSYSIDFGDGKTCSGSQCNLVHTYTSAGTYSAVISSGDYSASTHVIVSAASAAPTCSVSASPSSLTSGQSTTLSWNSTNATSARWVPDTSGRDNIPPPIGTPGTSGSMSFTPPPAQVGTTYGPSVFLQVTGSGGSATCSASMTIASSEHAAFDSNVFSQTSATPTISGTASGVSQVGVVISGKAGDKAYGSGLIPVTNGHWSVTVSPALPANVYIISVYDANNAALISGAGYLTVAPTAATLVATPSSGNAPLTVTFSGSVPGNGYQLNFGDTQITSIACDFGCTTTSVGGLHTYSSPGTYTATVTGSGGQTATATITVGIHPCPYYNLPACTINQHLGPSSTDANGCPVPGVCVNNSGPVASIDSFTVSPAQVRVGSPVNLSWSTSNASSCSLQTIVSGSVTAQSAADLNTGDAVIVYPPSQSTTYRLICSASGGTSVQKDVSVTVLAPYLVPQPGGTRTGGIQAIAPTTSDLAAALAAAQAAVQALQNQFNQLFGH